MKTPPDDDESPTPAPKSRAHGPASVRPRGASGASFRAVKAGDALARGMSPSLRGEGSGRTSALPQINAQDHDDDAFASTTNTKTMAATRSPSPRRDILTVASGPSEGSVHILKDGENWLGRSDECDIILMETGVSRKHACITLTESGAVLRENKAKNGTFVNERAVVEHELRPGDEIRLGDLTILVYSRSRDAAGLGRRKARSIDRMVAGVAHQLNTPLGVANTANALIESLANELRGAPVSERVAELLGDLQASAGLVGKNLKRTDELVRNFKQLSAQELVDDLRECDLAAVVSDCIDDVREQAGDDATLKIVTNWAPEATFPWIGFPTSLHRVVEHLLQNSRRYGYVGKKGVVDLRLKTLKGRYRLEVEDYGVGIEESLQEQLFEPFVSSDRSGSAGGLGLAVVHAIVTNLLGGMISCNSTPGKGTKFIILLPFEVESFGD